MEKWCEAISSQVPLTTQPPFLPSFQAFIGYVFLTITRFGQADSSSLHLVVWPSAGFQPSDFENRTSRRSSDIVLEVMPNGIWMYRGLAICRAWIIQRFSAGRGMPIANRRYGRLPICATSSGGGTMSRCTNADGYRLFLLISFNNSWVSVRSLASTFNCNSGCRVCLAA